MRWPKVSKLRGIERCHVSHERRSSYRNSDTTKRLVITGRFFYGVRPLTSPVVILSTVAGLKDCWHTSELQSICQRDHAMLTSYTVAVCRHLFVIVSTGRRRQEIDHVWGRELGSSSR
jgi:hypothetical protein